MKLSRFIILSICILLSNFALAEGYCRLQFKKNLAPLKQQSTDYNCGPAALFSLLKTRKGYKVTEAQLAKIMKTDRHVGTSTSNFLKALEILELQGEFVSNLDLDIVNSKLQAGYGVILDIVLQGEAHWALLLEVNETQVILMDPWFANRGYRIMSKTEFYKIWKGEINGNKQNRSAILIK